MDIVVEATAVSIIEPDVLTSFSVISDLPVEQIDAQLRSAGLGHAADEHAWIAASALEDQAGKLASSPDWSDKFQKMVDFAISHGWTDESRTHVRAHIRQS